MRKLILLLLIPLLSFGQNQYMSSKMSFLYPNDYKLKGGRIIQDVLVKLVPKDIKKNENITIIYINEIIPYSDVFFIHAEVDEEIHDIYSMI